MASDNPGLVARWIDYEHGIVAQAVDVRRVEGGTAKIENRVQMSVPAIGPVRMAGADEARALDQPGHGLFDAGYCAVAHET